MPAAAHGRRTVVARVKEERRAGVPLWAAIPPGPIEVVRRGGGPQCPGQCACRAPVVDHGRRLRGLWRRPGR
jgi:hypothetical protein